MDLNSTPIWKNQHTFLKPVLFSPGQVFNGSNLRFANQQKGAVAVFDGKYWDVINPGETGQALIIANNYPSWGSVDSSILVGIVKPANGGTGLTSFEIGSMMYANSKNTLSTIKLGSNGQILSVFNNVPTWMDASGVQGEGKSSYLAVWSSESHLCASNIQINQNELIFNDKKATICLGATKVSTDKNQFSVQLDKDSIVVAKDTFAIQYDNKTIVKFYKGKLTNGTIPVERLDGVVSVKNGGTGIPSYSPGDILYASENGTLSVLSIDNTEGFVITSLKGRPQWAPANGSASSITSSSTLSLLCGTQHRAPIQFQAGELTSSPNPGAIEWDGDDLYFTTKDNIRKTIFFDGDNLNAKSLGVTEIVPLNVGGLGRDFSNAPIGSFLFVESQTSFGMLKPSAGHFLRIHPLSNLPIWSHAVVEINAHSGISIDTNNKYTPILTIDQTNNFNPVWEGLHMFKSDVILTEDTTLYLRSNQTSRRSQINFENTQEPAEKKNGDMWFDNNLFMYVNGATVNLTETHVSATEQAQYFCVFSDVTPLPNTKRKTKYLLPYGADGNTKIKWRLSRIDLRAEDIPVDIAAKIKVYLNNEMLLEQDLCLQINENSTSTQQFITPYAQSGDLLSFEYGETGGSDCWSLYLTAVSVR